MPIRHCQKCGLKVLIDESQAGANPFYCQRCTTAMKGPDAGGDDLLAAAAPVQRTPVPAPAAVAVAPPKPATVKVLCPYCKASFNGRIPQKPARGSCPVCQKELILLPNGDIRPAAGFDVSQWQAEGTKPAGKESGTKVLVKKYAADAGSPAARKESGTKVVARKAPEPPPPPPPEPEPALAPPEETSTDESAALPSWLDDTSEGRKSTAPPVEDAPAPEPAPESEEEVPVRLEDLPAAGPPIEEEAPPPPAKLPPAAIAPPPPPPPPKPTARKGAAASAGRRMTERRVAAVGGPAPTGAGKFMLALLLAALPVAACGALLGVQEKLKGTIVEQIGKRFVKGFLELDRRINPPAPKTAPPAEAPKPPPAPEEPAKPGPEDQARDENAILKIWNEWRFDAQKIKQLSVGADDAQKVEIEKAKEKQKEREKRMDELCELYKKTYGKEYDPRKQ